MVRPEVLSCAPWRSILATNLSLDGGELLVRSDDAGTVILASSNGRHSTWLNGRPGGGLLGMPSFDLSPPRRNSYRRSANAS
jgi:hypothetical protein